MRNRNLVLTVAGAAALSLGLIQATRRSARQPIEDVPKKPRNEDTRTREVPGKGVPVDLLIRQIEMPDWKQQWELHRKQDRERNFFEWRDAKEGTHAFASSMSKG